MILPARICSGDLALRPLRLSDCRRFLVLDRETGPAASPPIIPGHYSWPGLWWRLRRRMDICYSIEVNGTACGLIGLYDFTPEGSAKVALAVFDRSARRRGIGSGVFSLLAGMLTRHRGLIRLHAEVERGDEGAVLFWTKMGFAQTAAPADGRLILSRDLPQAA